MKFGTGRTVTLYVKPDDRAVWEQAIELKGADSMSAMVVKALELYVKDRIALLAISLQGRP